MDTFGIILIVGTAIAAVLFYVFVVKKSDRRSLEEIAADAEREAQLEELLRQARKHGDRATVREITNGTYFGELPFRLPDGEWYDKYDTLMAFDLEGVNFRSGMQKYYGKNKVRLIEDKKNVFDENAIKIINSDGAHVGYVPQDLIQKVKDCVDIPAYATAYIGEKIDEYGAVTVKGIVILKRQNKDGDSPEKSSSLYIDNVEK